MKRFWVENQLLPGKRVPLNSDEAKHAIKVMRLQLNDEVLLCNGSGEEFLGIIEQIDRQSASIFVKEKTREHSPRKTKIFLLQSILKNARMDWLIEKATELGVDTIIPIYTQFSVAPEKEERWERIMKSAIKQSGQLLLPQLMNPQEIKTALEKIPPNALKILLSPEGKSTLQSIWEKNSHCDALVLALGPEGGFSPEEESLLINSGFQTALLAKSILRGETASIAALSIATHLIDF